MSPRLASLDGLPSTVDRPSFVPAQHGAGIVHLGLGAFHKAHQATCTDTALGAEGGDWRIIGVSLRNPDAALQLRPQNGLYTVIERSDQGSRARVIGSIKAALHLGQDRRQVLDALIAPETRIVSLTVTEKGYGIDRTTSGIDENHSAIQHDLLTPNDPVGVAGLLVWALSSRRAAGIAPFTVLCCDNLPDNGSMLRALVVDFARRTAPDIADFIANEVAFPSTMVDRITPASTAETMAAAEIMTGHQDLAAIETEAFTQWVIEDTFPNGRPAWQKAGVFFVDDVTPYETMKLRMLNGAHSMLAYAGFLSGHIHVADVMGDVALTTLVRRHMDAAAATLSPLPDVDFGDYAKALIARFSNPHLLHETYQIAMDGTEKLPQRILAPACDALASGQPLGPFAFATAAWMRYTQGKTDDGKTYALRDPQEARIAAALEICSGAEETVQGLFSIPGLFPEQLAADPGWREAVTSRYDSMVKHGVRGAVEIEAAQR